MNRPETCRLCKNSTDFNREHVPPRCTWNDSKVIDKDVMKELLGNWDDEPDDRGRQSQQGLWLEVFCKECNNFLGREYVPAYREFVVQAVRSPTREGRTKVDFLPLRIFKQVIAMMVAMNDDGPEWDRVRALLLDVQSTDFPSNVYRVLMFRCGGTLGRLCGWGQTVDLKAKRVSHVSEVAVRPVGFQMRFGHSLPTTHMVDITRLHTHAAHGRTTGEIAFDAALPVVSRLFNDFRSREQLRAAREENLAADETSA